MAIARVSKPEEELYLIAMERAGVSAAESVFVDDRVENVEAARALGMHALPCRGSAQTMAAINGLRFGR